MKESTRWKVLVAVFIVFTLAISYFNYSFQFHKLTNESKASISDELSEHSQTLQSEVDELTDDLHFLTSVPPISGIIRATEQEDSIDPLDNSTLSTWKRRLERIFQSYISSHEHVYQIRFIGVANNGLELVRVEQTGPSAQVMRGSKLQEKSSRDYFQEITSFNSKDIYISDVNLNRESGVIQVPHNPTVRFAQKVYNDAGKLFGFIILNVNADGLFQKIINNTNQFDQIYITNHNGEFLFDPNNRYAFNFEFDDSNTWHDIYRSDGAIGFLSETDEYGHTTTTEGIALMAEVPLMQGRNAIQIRLFKDTQHLFYSALTNTAYGFTIFIVGLFVFVVFFLVYRSKSRSQALLEIERAQNTSIIESSQDAIIGVTMDGKIRDWNPSASKMFGYQKEEVLGQSTDTVLLTEETLSEENRIREELRQGRPVNHFETTRRTKNGTSIEVSISASPIYDANGELVGVSKIIRDITEQKRISKQLEEFNQSLEQQVRERTDELNRTYTLQSAILTNATYLVIATDTQGVITLLNPSAEALLGYNADDVVGKETPQLFHLESEVRARAEEFSQALGETVEPGFDVFVVKSQKGLRNEHEWSYVSKSGQSIPVYLAVSALTDSAGEIIGYLGIAADISELVVQRKESEALKSQLTTATNVANIGIWGWNAQTNEVSWSDIMYQLYDLPSSVTISYDKWISYIMVEDRARVIEHFQQHRQGAEVAEICFDIISEKGARKTIQAAATQDYNPFDGSTQFVGINRDVSDQVQYEKALRQAKEIADNASRTKSEFVANMSHEIRTPMNAIIGLLELLRKTELDTKQLDFVMKSDGAARSLLNILNDILDFSKVEAGKLDIDPHPFKVLELSTHVATILTSNIGEKDIELVVDVAPSVPTVITLDSHRLQQIVLNIASNAVKFTSHGVVCIHFSCQQQEEGQELVIVVSDTGIGIPSAKQERIFEAFTQAETSTVREYGGTGLGLVITKMLIELMDGQLVLQSEENVGTTFTARIPFQDFNEAQPFPVLENALNVLLMDDLPQALTAAMHAVEILGWHAVSAQDQTQLLAELNRAAQAGQPFDLVIIDYDMPAVSGAEVVTAIRQLAPEVFAGQVFMLTPHNKALDLIKLNAEGCSVDAVLDKPLTPASLLQNYVDLTLLESQREAAQERQKPLEGIDILLVEDNATNQLVAREILQSEGAKITIAVNGEEAVAWVKEYPDQFDLLLMDIQMPVMDGYEATRIIRETLHREELPILAMTANALATDKAKALEQGMNGHISKPFNTASLINMILVQVKGEEYSPTPRLEQARPAPLDSVTEPRAGESALLNVEAALQRLNHMHALYLQALDAYIQDSEAILSQVPEYVSEQNKQDTCELLHAFKGTSATVGAERLAELLKTLEGQLKQNQYSLYAESMAEIQYVHLQTLELAQQYRQQADATQEPSARTGLSKVHAPQIRTLYELLKANNMEAIHAFEQLHCMVSSEVLEEIRDMVHGLNFKRAADTLARRLEISA
ncbi:Signal transduction histidine-protein kinase BarA [Marinomonas aquimarina]|uniref:Sensory/regulatory protein RpfC n=1 Tax=Marinomonas aquimarina TaxID=295068 RepID=A0A1A8TI31_9GAMM|nr:PAS domain S-box protein [Marinomonas aquimarina]SBS33290.1 Signal transduction histidine-protein kinase BarA [Marinomonas aquimarina]